MASIPVGSVAFGTATSWLQASLTPGEHRYVLANSNPGRPITMTVRNKVLAKTAQRTYDVVQVTIQIAHPRLGEGDTWVVDNVTTTVSLPVLTVSGVTFAARLERLLAHTAAYWAGGLSDADLTSHSGVLLDNVADQLTMGLV